MTEEQIALARRLVAASWWEWPLGVAWVAPGASIPIRGWYVDGQTYVPFGALPDLTDDATAGVLLGMLGRLTWTSAQARPEPYAAGVAYCVGDRVHNTMWRPIMGEAVAVALLAVRGDR